MVEGWDASNMGDDEWLEDRINGWFWDESFGQGGIERLHCTYVGSAFAKFGQRPKMITRY